MLEFEIAVFNQTGQVMSSIALSHRLGPPLLVVLLAATPVQAQIVTDGSVGPKVSLSGGEIKIGAELGTRRGDNLFHSFEKFGIATGHGENEGVAEGKNDTDFEICSLFPYSERKITLEKSFSLLAKIACQLADEFR